MEYFFEDHWYSNVYSFRYRSTLHKDRRELSLSESFLADLTARRVWEAYMVWLEGTYDDKQLSQQRFRMISEHPFLLHSVFFELLNAAISLEYISSGWNIFCIYKKHPSKDNFRIALDKRKSAVTKKMREYGLYSTWVDTILCSHFDEFIEQADEFIEIFRKNQLPILSGGRIRLIPIKKNLRIQAAQNLAIHISLERIRRISHAYGGNPIEIFSFLKALSNKIVGRVGLGKDAVAAFKKQRNRLKVPGLPVKEWLVEDYQKISVAYLQYAPRIHPSQKELVLRFADNLSSQR